MTTVIFIWFIGYFISIGASAKTEDSVRLLDAILLLIFWPFALGYMLARKSK